MEPPHTPVSQDEFDVQEGGSLYVKYDAQACGLDICS